MATQKSPQAASVTPSPVFGPRESPAIFEKKWYDKIKLHMSKLPIRDAKDSTPDGYVARAAQWSIEAFDFVVAFETQAKMLEYAMDSKSGAPPYSVLLANNMRHMVNGFAKVEGKLRGRRVTPGTAAADILLDKIVMGELEGIWWTDEKLTEEEVETAIHSRRGPVDLDKQSCRLKGSLQKFLSAV